MTKPVLVGHSDRCGLGHNRVNRCSGQLRKGAGPINADERQRRILARARTEGRVDVGMLAIELGAAPETVRRDLGQLSGRGLLLRTHGGAYPVESAGFESDVAHRATSSIAEKHRIAAAAADRLRGAETVYIDEGVTPQFVAEALSPEGPLTVVTSSLLAASALAESPSITVLMLGGRLRGRTMATVDHWATRMLGDLVIDLAFLGANGISREHGLTTPDPAVAAVKSQVMARARRKVFVGLHSKFGVSSFCRFADVSDFEALVTDTGLSTAEALRYSVLGPQVIRA
jgi:DeoR family transcriptional regulator, fructose operon transcriptional repressor